MPLLKELKAENSATQPGAAPLHPAPRIHTPFPLLSLNQSMAHSFTQSQVLNHSLAFLPSSLITVHVVSPENKIRKHKKRAKQKEQRTKKKYIGVLTR